MSRLQQENFLAAKKFIIHSDYLTELYKKTFEGPFIIYSTFFKKNIIYMIKDMITHFYNNNEISFSKIAKS
jgi:hypothetical protein